MTTMGSLGSTWSADLGQTENGDGQSGQGDESRSSSTLHARCSRQPSASTGVETQAGTAASAASGQPRPPVDGLTKSNSTVSAVSMPVTGTLPYGSLQIHQSADPAPPRPVPPAKDALAGQSSAMILENGDVFLILDLPAGFTVGCDANVVTARRASPVLGLRDLAPGVHLVFVSNPAAMTRCGYWFVTGADRSDAERATENVSGNAAGVVRIKQWDRYNEILGEPASQVEARAYRDDETLKSLYPALLPCNAQHDVTRLSPPPSSKDPPYRGQSAPDPAFSADGSEVWPHLTSCISETLLARVTGKKSGNAASNVLAGSAGSATPSDWPVDTTDCAKGDINFTRASNLFKPILGSELTFLLPRGDSDLAVRLSGRLGSSLSPSPERASMDGSGASISTGNSTAGTTPTLSTTPSQDSSALLMAILARPVITEADIIGELQFAFLNALHLGNISCLEYWWHFVLRVLLRAHRLVLSRPTLVCSIIITMHAQLVYSGRCMGLSLSPSSSVYPSVDLAPASAAEAEGDVGGDGTGILDTMPRNKRRLREALTLYKRQLDESLLGLGDQITKDQGAVGLAFAGLEAWFWTIGWDLRADYVRKPPDPALSAKASRSGVEPGFDDSSDDDEEYQPVVVELDDHGREVGLVSFHGRLA